MKGLFPNEFPFNRKRKSPRRKAAKPAVAAATAVKAAAAELRLSASATIAAPVAEVAANVAAIGAEAAPTVATVLAEAEAPAAQAVATPAAETAPIVAEAPVVAAAPVVVASPVAVTPVTAAAQVVSPSPAHSTATVSGIPVRVAGHATSRASLTPAASAVEMARAASAATDAAGYTGPERRRSPRQALRAKAIYRNDMNPAGAGPVQLLNFSMSGVRIWSTKPMKKGERGNVKMEIGPVKWSGRVKVVACDAHDDDGYSVGCEFATNEMSRRVA